MDTPEDWNKRWRTYLEWANSPEGKAARQLPLSGASKVFLGAMVAAPVLGVGYLAFKLIGTEKPSFVKKLESERHRSGPIGTQYII